MVVFRLGDQERRRVAVASNATDYAGKTGRGREGAIVATALTA